MKNVRYFGGSIFKIKMNESNIWAMGYHSWNSGKMLGNISDCTKILLLQFTDQKSCNKLTVS